MGSALGPLHTLFLDEAFTNHLVDGGFHKGGADGVAVAIPFAEVWNVPPIIVNVGVEFVDTLLEFAERVSGRFNILYLPLQMIDTFQGLKDIPMPEIMFGAFERFLRFGCENGILLLDSFDILAKNGKAHWDMKPI